MIEEQLRIREMLNQPRRWRLSEAEALYAGVDLGTYKAVVIVVDEKGRPRAASLRKAEVVRSGLVLDYIGALQLLREMMEEIRGHSRLPIEAGATSYPPQTETANVETTRYILEGADLKVLAVLDEPTAANRVMRLRDGAIVDVGGGTTGIAVFRDGELVYSNDEATGGVHLTLVLAGNQGVGFEAAENIKTDPRRAAEVLPVVRPVIEKMAAIVEHELKPFPQLENICVVGGTCELAGFRECLQASLARPVQQPAVPQVITPYGIALSCLGQDVAADSLLTPRRGQVQCAAGQMLGGV